MMPIAKPQIAFIAAALVLLVMPLLVMFGLTALGIATHAGMMARMSRMMNGDARNMFLVVFVVWALLVFVAVLAFISYLMRRASRS
jgi:hypothetical protein